MPFILDRLKEKFGDEDKDIEGFPDMNYIIGNTSALDIGQVPTPMKERIGSQAQIGGGVMEVKVSNPATFTIEREDMINAISQLGLDITLHSDMNAGYASAQKSGQQNYGYDTVHDYFGNYLQELASFKEEVKNRGDGKPLFHIGRINPHISTTPMPPLSERMETDVGVDPFGFTINEYDENARKRRNKNKQNIYKNPRFLRKLYHTLFLEVANYPFQNYQTFASYSHVFNDEWLKAQHIAAWELFKDEAETIEDKLGTILTAQNQDQGIGSAWRRKLDNWEMEKEFPRFKIKYEEEEQEEGPPNREYKGLEEVGTVELSEILRAYGGNPAQIRALDGVVYSLKESQPDIQRTEAVELFIDNLREATDLLTEAANEINSKIDKRSEQWKKEIESALKELWKGESFEKEDQNISQEAKWTALQRHLEIEQIRLFENAYRLSNDEDSPYIGKFDKKIEEKAADVFSGKEPEKLFEPDERENIQSAEEMHEDMLERILSGQQFQREMWKESTIFYQVIPAWMSESNYNGHKYHDGWAAPKFIWETLVEKWNDKEGVDINLEDPRNGQNGPKKFLDLLEENKEFQSDVAAAAGACYVWGHFTQHETNFSIDRKETHNGEIMVEEDTQHWTWIEWMNKYGIGVNLETMAGAPQQKFKIWRPKDIAVAAHAVNLTARNRLEEKGELGGREEIHEELDGCPVKFTIDMEHVASLGADPWKEMEYLMDQESDLAESDYALQIDSEKPLAKILRQYHLMDPGVESEQGTYHGAFERGNKMLYRWLYGLVEEGFARNENEPASIMFEQADNKAETTFMMRVSMNLIELGVPPEDLDPSAVDPGEEPENEEEALIARFFGMDNANYQREWAKIEEHAFDPLKGLLEAEEFDYTYSGRAATENDNRPAEWQNEEYR